MLPELTLLRHAAAAVHQQLKLVRANRDAGYSTEAVVVIALLVAMAVTAVSIIAAKVLSAAHGINTGP